MNAFIDIDMKPGILEIQFLIRFSLQQTKCAPKQKYRGDENTSGQELYNQKVDA